MCSFEQFIELSIFLQLEVLIHVDIYTFMECCKVNKKINAILSGKSIEEHGVLAHYLYEARSKKFFKESIILFREELTWIDFYNRIINFYLRKYKEKKISRIDPDDYIYSLLYSFIRKGKLMECKIIMQDNPLIFEKYNPNYMLEHAAHNNHIVILDYFYDNFNMLPHNSAYVSCLQKGLLNVVEWLEKHGVKFDVIDCQIKDIIRDTTLEGINWLIKNKIRMYESYMNGVVIYGNTDVFLWFIKQGCEVSKENVHLVMRYGHVKILDYLLEHEKELVVANAEEGLESAILEGTSRTLDAIKWLYENIHILPKDKSVNIIASLGRKDIMEYLYSIKYPFRPDIINYSITSYKNNYDMILWLYSIGYQIDNESLQLAKKYKYDNIVSWLRSKDVRSYPYSSEEENIFE